MAESKGKIVIALGGNALQTGKGPATAEAQLEVVKNTCTRVAEISGMGYEVAVVHGNGPQVGRIVMASEAASTSPIELVLLVASVSMSLGFMNLLPIPPLDGGKILIEIVQLIIRRPLSIRAQTIVSYVGVAFFLFIFVVALRNDIVRYILG